MKKIYLIGFMGSGKSTIGSELSKKDSLTFVDTDQFIEEKYKTRIARIFEEDGEETFRNYEVETLKDLIDFDVIATGGGIIERKENKVTMEKNGVIIYLHTSFKEIDSRLKNDVDRPLWNNDMDNKMALYKRRIPLYKDFADHVIQTDDKTVEEIVREIEEYTKSV